jgi:hypothetical protein
VNSTGMSVAHRNNSPGVLDTFGSNIHFLWHEFEGGIHGSV